MLKLLTALSAAGILFVASSAGAVGAAGCGLGSMVFSKNTKGHQILAATTNATFGSQTFGITFGTSNCTAGGIVKADRAQEAFVEANFESLQRDMAVGEGEYLSTFGTLLGCNEGAQGALGNFTRTHFETLSSEGVSPNIMLQSLKGGMSTDPVLAQSCALI